MILVVLEIFLPNYIEDADKGMPSRLCVELNESFCKKFFNNRKMPSCGKFIRYRRKRHIQTLKYTKKVFVYLIDLILGHLLEALCVGSNCIALILILGEIAMIFIIHS